MKIIVAGAGAGKTTSMAEAVLKRYKQIDDGKIIYVVTYTNAAKEHIKNKIIEEHGSIPKRIKVETSHVFLLQEIIYPFHHLLYGQLFETTSIIDLPTNNRFKATRLKELRNANIIHVEEVTKFAKYILVGKSSDRKNEKERRKKALAILRRYLDSLFVDEVQDIDSNFSQIIELLDANHFNLHLVGDPKQDLRGQNELRKLMGKYNDFVKYKNENYRSPISHIKFSNSYVVDEEEQICKKDDYGNIKYIFESDIEVSSYLLRKSFDLTYIYQKNDRFITDDRKGDKSERTLKYELRRLILKSQYKDNNIDKIIYIFAKKIRNEIYANDNWTIINKLGIGLSLNLNKQEQARMYEVLNLNRESKKVKGIVVDSIDKVKGLEGEKCLFILSRDLSEYFLKLKQEQNKMTNYLYVALTRSKKELTILITEEVEEKYSREWINNKLQELLG